MNQQPTLVTDRVQRASKPSPPGPVAAGARRSVVSLSVYTGTYAAFIDAVMQAAHRHEPRSACFANVHMVVEARRDPAIAAAVNGADWVCPDGVPLTWAMRLLYGLRQERVAGMDVTDTLLARAAAEGVSVYFFGSTPEVLARIRAQCADRFPGLVIAGMVSPPFRPATPAEDAAAAAAIRASGAGLVFVGLGCPKQERWMARLRGQVPAVLLGVGGALPVLAGDQARAAAWIRRAGLEWLFRLLLEPRRLLKRYAVTNPLYVYYLLKQWLRR
ncbi:WecB/TagA/CpsF family glycosyltransferase [Spirosoma luteolum]